MLLSADMRRAIGHDCRPHPPPDADNFRSYHAAQIEIGAGLVVLVGPNGAGKTNLIEAISFLAPGRGLRRATLEDVAFSEGDGSWAVSADVEGALGLGDARHRHRGAGGGGRHRSRANAASIASRSRRPRPSPITCAWSGSCRRWTGCSTARPPSAAAFSIAWCSRSMPSTGSRVNALERALRSRNRLLEDPRPDPHWLDAIEHETAELAVAVTALRVETVDAAAGARSPRARRSLAVPGGRDRARRLDGEARAAASRGRDRGPLSRGAARQPRARRRRRPHARRAASHRSRGRLCAPRTSRPPMPRPASRRRC